MEIVSLHRYPVKSMMGEELNACHVTYRGIFGDRMYGVIDVETGKLANAKHPKKWPTMFRHRAHYVEEVTPHTPLPPVRITIPDGTNIISDDPKVNDVLSKSFQRPVMLSSPTTSDVQFEGYVPEEMKELDDRGTVFTRTSPTETFFDLAMLHLLTTNTLDELRARKPESRFETRRFRPNIVINSPNDSGFIEESWIGKTITIGQEVKLKIFQPTKRCVMTTLAQGDLPNDIHVLKTAVRENNGNVGVYAEVIQPGKIKVGDKVNVLPS